VCCSCNIGSEKTLALLWSIVLHWDIQRALKREVVEHEILQIRKCSHSVATESKQLVPAGDVMEADAGSLSADLDVYITCDILQSLLGWAKAVAQVQTPKLVALHGREIRVPVHNFTTSFGDGRVLCLLLNYYHPQLLVLSAIRMIEETKQDWELTDAERADRKMQKELQDQQHKQGGLNVLSMQAVSHSLSLE